MLSQCQLLFSFQLKTPTFRGWNGSLIQITILKRYAMSIKYRVNWLVGHRSWRCFEKLTQLKEETPYTNRQLTLAATISALFLYHVWWQSLWCARRCSCNLLWLCLSSVNKYVRIPLSQLFAELCQALVCWHRSGRAIPGFPSSWLIIAGAVMPFVPGIALTNAVRDLMTNHLNSGMSKIFETLLITLALGAGTCSSCPNEIKGESIDCLTTSCRKFSCNCDVLNRFNVQKYVNPRRNPWNVHLAFVLCIKRPNKCDYCYVYCSYYRILH